MQILFYAKKWRILAQIHTLAVMQDTELTTMAGKTIILDLDYTIFQTDTIDKNFLTPFFQHLRTNLKSSFGGNTITDIIADLWKDPWDIVISRYGIPKEIFLNSIKVLESLPSNLNISTYPDYHHIKNYSGIKFLVTTSSTSLQKAKIKALDIENDFTEIIINDTLIESKTKLDIFKELILKYNLDPEKTYVIGDNPNSEIKAGNYLNMITIQILRDNVVKGDNAKYYIKSFAELCKIIVE
jgi:putative hydrolase of the HAD superfamily